MELTASVAEVGIGARKSEGVGGMCRPLERRPVSTSLPSCISLHTSRNTDRCTKKKTLSEGDEPIGNRSIDFLR